VPEGCDDGKDQRRGGATMVKTDGGSSSVRERRKARESSRAKGKGAGCSGVEIAFYRGRGSTGEVTTGGNWRWLMVLTSLMMGWG
jgi:hypothetical protein